MNGAILFSHCLQQQYPKAVCEAIWAVANSMQYIYSPGVRPAQLERAHALLPEPIVGEPIDTTELWELCHQQLFKPEKPVFNTYLCLRMILEQAYFTFSDDSPHSCSLPVDLHLGLHNLFTYCSQFPWHDFADWQTDFFTAVIKMEYDDIIRAHRLPAWVEQYCRPRPVEPPRVVHVDLDPPTSLEDFVCKKDTIESLYKAMECLDERSRQVVVLHYGLGEEEPLTLEEIGQRMGVTRERVRQIELRALRKLRTAVRKVGL